ncbi:family 1 encapsulin nanocompartment shell protein [Mechercharimyces sp. CAU 1602]|uniref:family 1 encapsulin nanocompartment shell protein n=1 Tax=Mechercharimyces sp. CAU 1602 TaxID=2973933 RepID=UPI002163A5D8|nr:family 1 encapsulin nanocompartment shell protein [Mechercharimyces sp. CAU 1602]MCS1350085.1 bacteriocin family protein [Mechercharimyces sp. CAU 1602]
MSHSDSPLSHETSHELQRVVIETARRQLVARRFLSLYGPLGAGIQSVPHFIYSEPKPGHLDLTGEGGKLAEPSSRVNLDIPIIYKDFLLYWRDLEMADKLDTPIDLSGAADAAAYVAFKEDDLIFNGDNSLHLQGIMNVKGRHTLLREDWIKAGHAFQDIVEARSKLLAAGHAGPYALVLSPDLYALLHRVHPGTHVLEIEHVRELVTDGVYQSSAIKGQTGVLLATGSQNLDIAVGQDLHAVYVDGEDMNHRFRVYETLVPRIKRPTAICTLESQHA